MPRPPKNPLQARLDGNTGHRPLRDVPELEPLPVKVPEPVRKAGAEAVWAWGEYRRAPWIKRPHLSMLIAVCLTWQQLVDGCPKAAQRFRLEVAELGLTPVATARIAHEPGQPDLPFNLSPPPPAGPPSREETH